MTCFLVFEVETSLLSTANTTINHGIEIPAVVQYSQSSIHLSLTVDSNLVVNEQYLATITAINGDGERNHNVTVEFGLIIIYCVLLKYHCIILKELVYRYI